MRVNPTYVAIGNNSTFLQTTVYMRKQICQGMDSEAIDTLWTTLELQLETWKTESETERL